MTNLIRNIDKLITTSGTEVDFENIQAEGSGSVDGITSVDGKIGIGTTSPATTLDTLGFQLRSDQFWYNGGQLRFVDKATGTAERMRIDSSGKILIATSAELYTPDTIVHIKQSNISSGNNACLALQNMNASSNSGVRTILFMNSSGTRSGNINQTNSSITVNSSSDYRLKENITNITDGITRVKQLNPSRFNFISDPDRIVDGFIADEAQEVVPESVTGTKDSVDDEGNPEYQGIDQSKLVPLLTAALQEAIAKIEMLESRIAALEAKLA